MDNFYDLSDDVIATFKEIYEKKSFPVNIKFGYLGSSKQKQLIKLTKVNEQYEYLTGKEMLVVVNEDLYDKFDETSITILIEQEMDKISVNLNTGKIKMTKPDLTTFSGIVNKYGIAAVSKANQVEELTVEQSEDMETEFLA